jgi:hypothetical protein
VPLKPPKIPGYTKPSIPTIPTVDDFEEENDTLSFLLIEKQIKMNYSPSKFLHDFFEREPR